MGDILLHEIGWSAEPLDKETKERKILGWPFTEDLLSTKIEAISMLSGGTKPPIVFLTNTPTMHKQLVKEGLAAGEFVPGFRYEVAKTKPYKGTRKNPKPFHFDNIQLFLRQNYQCIIAQEGLEADDLLAQYQLSSKEPTIICSRDKDLRMVPGLHYSWECGESQPAIGPTETDELGWMNWETGIGYGLFFFYYQMIVGDSVDNIPGLYRKGKAYAKKVLEGCTTHKELFEATKAAYIENVGLCTAKDYWMEQAQLLWIGGDYKLPEFKED